VEESLDRRVAWPLRRGLREHSLEPRCGNVQGGCGAKPDACGMRIEYRHANSYEPC
jgi:hypothetical protein